jgi:3-oxoacyl-(acyl-carrier-protein) synthase
MKFGVFDHLDRNDIKRSDMFTQYALVASDQAIADSGFDPEIASFNPLQSGIDDGVYPQPRTILAGLNLSF